MSEPIRAQRLTPEMCDLLAAIRDAVDVPLPGFAEADERAHAALMTRRLSDLHAMLSVALDPQWIATTDPTRQAAAIRTHTAKTPVTYTIWQQPQDGGEQ